MIAEFERRRVRWFRRPFGIVILTQTERQAELNGDRSACNTREFRTRAAGYVDEHGERVAGWIDRCPAEAAPFRLTLPWPVRGDEPEVDFV